MVEHQPSKLFYMGSNPIGIKILRMAEWLKAAVLKAVVRCTVGSNPTPF